MSKDEPKELQNIYMRIFYNAFAGWQLAIVIPFTLGLMFYMIALHLSSEGMIEAIGNIGFEFFLIFIIPVYIQFLSLPVFCLCLGCVMIFNKTIYEHPSLSCFIGSVMSALLFYSMYFNTSPFDSLEYFIQSSNISLMASLFFVHFLAWAFYCWRWSRIGGVYYAEPEGGVA